MLLYIVKNKKGDMKLKINICKDCLKEITLNLTQPEILLLQAMKKNNIETPQLSVDESKLITLVKDLTPYKIKFILQRFTLIYLIDSVKVGTTKYFITENGKQVLELFMEETMKIKNNKKG